MTLSLPSQPRPQRAGTNNYSNLIYADKYNNYLNVGIEHAETQQTLKQAQISK